MHEQTFKLKAQTFELIFPTIAALFCIVCLKTNLSMCDVYYIIDKENQTQKPRINPLCPFQFY